MPIQYFNISAGNISSAEVRHIFKIIDKDGSGTVSGSEFIEVMRAIGCSSICFVDKDRDGKMGFEEFLEMIEKYKQDRPTLDISGNILKYLKEHNPGLFGQAQAQAQPSSLGDISNDDLQTAFNFIDTNRNGSLSPAELEAWVKSMGCRLKLEPFLPNKTDLNFSDFAKLIRDYDAAFPHMDLDNRLIRWVEYQRRRPKPAAYFPAPKPSPAYNPSPANNPSPSPAPFTIPTPHAPVTIPNPKPAAATPFNPNPAINPAKPAAPSPSSGGRPPRRKALLVGINYTSMPQGRLQGCINDVKNQVENLKYFGFQKSDMKILVDNDPSAMPTTANMKNGIRWLLDGAVAGDFLFFHYSGHGSQVPDKTGQEPDGKNECLVPIDIDWKDKIILDNDLRKWFYDDAPAGVNITCVYDCCHSGTMSDLSVMLERSSNIPIPRYLPPPPELESEIRAFQQSGLERAQPNRIRPTCHANSISFSGCQDNQTSADAPVGGQCQGAMTWSMTETLRKANYNITNEELIYGMRRTLRGKYTQVPQLTSNSGENFKKLYLRE